MTELTQPLAAAPSEAAMQPAVQSAAQSAGTRCTTFSELVYVHFDWWKALRKGTLTPAAAENYAAARASFEERHGEIVSAYWCSHVESAVALTQKKRRVPWASPISTFHRESDWATQAAPEIAAELHHCDELAVKAKTVLTGVRQVICLQLMMACTAHLLSLVDSRVTHEEEKNAEALAREQKAFAFAEEYYSDAANGQAQVSYFVGMAAVAGVIGSSKFIYDLWGDTVNVASRMESHGVPGMIQITRPVYESLKDEFEFEERGTVEVKGKGALEVWLLCSPEYAGRH